MSTFDSFPDYKFPKPLSKVELIDCFKKCRDGDSFSREKLIVHNMRLVFRLVNKKFSNVSYDKEELISIGTVGLIKAIDTFDTEREIQFATYAAKCINNEILMFLRKLNKD